MDSKTVLITAGLFDKGMISFVDAVCRMQNAGLNVQQIEDVLLPMKPIGNGEAVVVILKGKIIQSSDAHGRCYLVAVPQKDYEQPRQIWLDEDEVRPPKQEAQQANVVKLKN